MDPIQSQAWSGLCPGAISPLSGEGVSSEGSPNLLGLTPAGVSQDVFQTVFGLQTAQAGGVSPMDALTQIQVNLASMTTSLMQIIQTLTGGSAGQVEGDISGLGGGNALTDMLMPLLRQVAEKEKAAESTPTDETTTSEANVPEAEKPDSTNTAIPAAGATPVEGITELSDDKATRIQQVVEAAKRTYPDNPVMAQLAATQALLESGIHHDSPSSLAKDDKNLFGIKAEGTAGWVSLPTEEQDAGGNAYTVQAEFGKNATVEDSFKQHKEILSLDRYNAVWQAGTFEEAAARVREAGYATDVSYTDKLIAVYNDNLAQYF